MIFFFSLAQPNLLKQDLVNPGVNLGSFIFHCFTAPVPNYADGRPKQVLCSIHILHILFILICYVGSAAEEY